MPFGDDFLLENVLFLMFEIFLSTLNWCFNSLYSSTKVAMKSIPILSEGKEEQHIQEERAQEEKHLRIQTPTSPQP